ncbi:Phosphate transporter PHO1 [Acorus calamus]|uniref:Phosphate transporter PHO1 n=1 Tax=Acorus calamus TaxID=4465 RepID=A0AAV9E4S5_ACOCL|nr:Phosphate transporter PHO1 [Acorus calamus]
MVKFSKELEAQLIPEWKDAFLDYRQLKKNIKKIKLSQRSPTADQKLHNRFGFFVFHPFQVLKRSLIDGFSSSSSSSSDKWVEKNQGDEEDLHGEDLVQLFSQEDEVKAFYAKLDEELHKVNNFYKTKEGEFIERGDALNKQLQILQDLKQVLHARRRKSRTPSDVSRSLSRSDSSVRSTGTASDISECDETAMDEVVAALERNGVNFVSSTKTGKAKKGGKPRPGAMRIDLSAGATTPTATSMIWEDLVNSPRKEGSGSGDHLGRKKIQCAEKLIRGAFVELYRGLGLLRTYSSLNMLAFTKILKKFDKVSNRQDSGNYLKAVKRSHFVSSDKVVKLGDEVESIFTKHFANNIEKSPIQVIELNMIQSRKIWTALHVLGRVDVILQVLVLLFAFLLFCPFNVFYRSTRFCFLRVIRNIVLSPFYKVYMVDFFMADQLTSLIPLLRHMEFTACYFTAAGLTAHSYETCTSSQVYKRWAYIISFLPYWWRAAQCFRRYWDENFDANHLANAGKYSSAMLAGAARILYAAHPTPMWLGVAIITSIFATIYQLYWDFVKDWGFFNPKSKNRWLRDDLILKNKNIYYVSIAINFVLRLAWVETLLHFKKIGGVEHRLVEFFLASIEIIRRGHWNFYRLENEHLNNVGKFRAVKTVPLPFKEMESDG